jgi:hypothetical protein
MKNEHLSLCKIIYLTSPSNYILKHKLLLLGNIISDQETLSNMPVSSPLVSDKGIPFYIKTNTVCYIMTIFSYL